MRGYSIGDRVLQPQYGTGTIRLVDEYHTVIDFDEQVNESNESNNAAVFGPIP